MENSDNRELSVISSFDRFYNHYTSVLKERDEYAEQVSSCSAETERLSKANEALQKDINSLHEVIRNFHQQVTESNELKEKNKELKEKCFTLEQGMKAQEQKHEDRLRQERKEHDTQMAAVVESKDKEVALERERCADLLGVKDRDVQQLKDAMAAASKDREDRITVLSMEYENKLAKVQRQKSQILQNTQHATNQDIFRKKLQHMKQTHDSEVQALRQQIRHLQTQASASALQPCPASPPGRQSSAFACRNKRTK